ncbi:transcriptional regulator [Streptomyces sp. CB02923]|uniref:MerR family transcriptional regulator n=1 Tax=Streptomyces sp. CB02923 TaxID=1718985 RepID=UPI00093CF482|nr:MerR family transcriptional regulator [Streptomyces sp. CB02923]OKI01458.1 transcriptional regulator [Streptomyces sp. CB02923]
MQISELSDRSGVSIASIKHYLRRGLLPPGRATALTRAEYGEQHIRRLRLIRALIGVRGLSVRTAKEVLDAASRYEGDPREALRVVLGAGTAPSGDHEHSGKASADVEQLLDHVDWEVAKDAPPKRALADTLASLRHLGTDFDWHSLVPYAELAQKTATLDLGQLGERKDPAKQAERVVLLTIMLEPALLALRRLAQENQSVRGHKG